VSQYATDVACTKFEMLALMTERAAFREEKMEVTKQDVIRTTRLSAVLLL